MSVGLGKEPNYQDIDPEFDIYISEFILLSYGVINEDDFDDVYIGFKKYEEKDETVGHCVITPFYRQIDIDVDWWKENTYQLSREELMYHEFGHCLLYRPHTEPTSARGILGWLERVFFDLKLMEKKGRLSDGCPISYMHPKIVSPYCIDKHYAYYIKELFVYEEEDTFYDNESEGVCGKGHDLKFFVKP